MDIWGERAPDGGLGVRIIPRNGVEFRIPVVIDDKPNIDTVADGHQVNNPIKLASFRVADWRVHVVDVGRFRDPSDGDIMITADGKKWDIGDTTPTTDGRYVVPLFAFKPR